MTIIISSVAVAVVAVILAIVLPLTLNNRKTPLSQTAESFINLVIRIKTPITLDSEAEIEAGYVLYDFMNETDRADKTVRESKETLDGYKSEYDVLRLAKDEEETNEKQAVLRESFENAVSRLPALSNLTAENGADVDAAFAIYEQLNEETRAESSVQTAYGKLTAAREKVDEIEREERLAQIAETANGFIDGVNGIGTVTLESIDGIEDLLYDYEGFSDEVKNFAGVAQAKETLDTAYNKYLVLKDDKDVADLKAAAEELSPTDTAVTLESERAIINAEILYENMSQRAKGVEGVAQAYEVIVAARARYDELFAVAEAERVRVFIEKANAVGTDIENVDITWFDVLDEAADAYWNLTYESQKLPEVEEAFRRWDAAQSVFDKKGYERLPMNDPNVLFSGHATNPILVLQMEANMIDPLKEFYGVSSTAELSQCVIVWLYVYVDGECVGRGEIPASALGHEIAASYIQSVLSLLSAENEKVVSGGSFAFALSLEDKQGEYISSAKTKVSAEKVYTW